MLAYIYSENTNEYVGPTIVLEDPLETIKAGKQIFSFPPNCTTLVPPTVGNYEIAVFNKIEDKWEIQPDYRGKAIYNRKGNFVIVTEIGDIPSGYSLEKPVTLQDLKLEKIEEAKTLYNSLINKIVEVGNVKVGRNDREKLLKALSSFGDHATIPYEDAENEVIIVTREDLENAEKYLYAYQMLLTKEKLSLISSIRAYTNKKSLSALVIKFDVDNELAKLMELSMEALDKYFATGE